MKLNVTAMAIACGLLWGVAVFMMGLANLIWSGYGQPFLDVVASIYPGYKAAGTLGDAVVGALYGLLDGAIGGLVLAWLYNRFATMCAKTA